MKNTKQEKPSLTQNIKYAIFATTKKTAEEGQRHM